MPDHNQHLGGNQTDEYYLRPEICSKCGGQCCKMFPGAVFPTDVDLSGPEHLTDMLKSRGYVVDWWIGEPRSMPLDDPRRVERAYFVRPRMKGEQLVLIEGQTGHPCVFLRQNGCQLAPFARPRGCRETEPLEDGNCVNHSGDKYESAKAWLPYHYIILEAVVAAEVMLGMRSPCAE